VFCEVTLTWVASVQYPSLKDVTSIKPFALPESGFPVSAFVGIERIRGDPVCAVQDMIRNNIFVKGKSLRRAGVVVRSPFADPVPTTAPLRRKLWPALVQARPAPLFNYANITLIARLHASRHGGQPCELEIND
jgi:hypothetical protein